MGSTSTTKRALLALKQLDVLEAAFLAVSKVTDDHINRAESKLGEIRPNEKPLGTIHNAAAKRLWVGWQIIQAMSLESKAKSKLADNDADENLLHAEYHKLDKLADLVEELFWLQARSDMGQLADCEGSGGVSLRKGWMMVMIGAPPGPAALIRKLRELGGEIIGPFGGE